MDEWQEEIKRLDREHERLWKAIEREGRENDRQWTAIKDLVGQPRRQNGRKENLTSVIAFISCMAVLFGPTLAVIAGRIP